jgi:hypothetical protein
MAGRLGPGHTKLRPATIHYQQQHRNSNLGCSTGRWAMGFNATRRYRDGKTVDIAILVAAIVVIIVLLGWALFG